MVNADTMQELLKQQRYQGYAWQKVIDAARQYAQMQATGSYVEEGRLCMVHQSDRAQYIEMFAKNVLSYSRDAFIDDARMGMALSNAKEPT